MTAIPECSDSNELAWLLDCLPEVKTLHPYAEAEYYGAAAEIARQLGRSDNRIRTGASWLHGWIWDPILYAQQLTPIRLKWFRHLVGTQAQADILTNAGYRDAHAVGSPFIYASSEKTTRRPKSLLVMPYHSLAHTVHDFNEELYADEIASLKTEFDVIVACISGGCLKRGMWKDAFEKRGISWVRGAKLDDQNALRRMATLFRSFECMTTHSFGSHVAYAGYSGCRVSLYGTYNQPTSAVFQNDPILQSNPALLKINLEKNQLSFLRDAFPQFFVHPRDGFSDYQWFADRLGEPCRRTPEEVGALLQWKPSILGFAQIRADWVSKDVRVLTKRIWRSLASTLQTQ